MGSYKTTGIILRRTNYGEADRILTFITPDRGKVEAIAKGVRRVTAKLGSHLELFSEVQLVLAKGKSLDVITGARLKHSWSSLTADYEAMRRAFLFCEMLNKLTEADTSKRLYELLAASLESLDSGLEPALVELYFKLHLLDETGHRPELATQKAAKYFFNYEAGSVEAAQAPSSVAISADEIKLWRLNLEYPLGRVAKIKGVNKAATSSLYIIDKFYDYLFGKRFKSAEI